ncbi:hypothetical protein PVIIG_00409 [Plasmodium vivax India VII]|uniref:Uncharacterized protein n=1 Tax=Plasmodium vivax India VII TaxID=1077284 RepID=A0A0J9SAQ7_PLAVI|nr:hypothetical protein PVIIG_00409 [Plasmodium vivax India VII]
MHKNGREITERSKGDYNKKKNLLTKFYLAFNKNCDANDHEFQCDGDAKKLGDNLDFVMLYKKFIRNIKNISNDSIRYLNILDNENNLDLRCIYLKYWIYNELEKVYIEKEKIPSFFTTWNSQKRDIFPGKTIPCDFDDLKLEEIKEIRKLYDYYMLYDTFKKSEFINAKYYKTAYCYYLNQFKDIYNNNETSCATYVSKNYCNEFNKYIKKNVKDPKFSSIDEYCNGENFKELFDVQRVDRNQSDYSEARDKYGFFQVLDQYHKDEENLIKTAEIENYNNICDIKCSYDNFTIDFKEICEKFGKKHLSLPKPNSAGKKIPTRYAKILNYLFNQELRNGQRKHNNEESYEKIKKNCSSDNKLNVLEGHLPYIEEKEYEKLNILYQLYDNFRNIDIQPTENSRTEEGNSPKYDEKCVEKYKEGIELYKKEKDKDFYYALKEFSILYEQYIYVKNLSRTNKLKRLPYFKGLDDPKEESNVQQEIYSINSTISDIYNNFSKHTSDKNLCAKYCHEIISPDKNNNDGIKSLCVKLVTNLKQLDGITGVKDNHNDRCSNLKYWTYDQIMNIFSTTGSDYENSSIINEINKVITRVNDELNVNKNCYFYVDGNFDQWNKEKALHDYFADFVNLNNTAPGDVNKNSNYCRYFKYIYDLYNEHIKKCCSRYIIPNEYMENKCPSFFKCDKKYYPIDLMSKLKCKNIDHKESVEDIFNSITVDLNVIKYSIFMNSFNQIINITNDPFYLFVLAVFGLLGFFFIFFIFYKVTRDTTYIYVHILYVNYIIHFLKTFRIMKYMYYK